MTIWKKRLELSEVQRFCADTLVSHLAIEFTEVGEDYLCAKMPVDARTVQPMGLLHGGASVTLAESLGSMAGSLCVDLGTQHCVGLEINANHVRAVRSGWVYGRARPLHNLPPVAALVCEITAVVARRLLATSRPSSLLRRDSASFAQLGPVS
ncbi:MAG: esterase [Proteobacteria bacterium]|nr:MAG: esterase [Pseudomonadota bacterium]